MTRIEQDIKFDFSDVLIKPKRSTLKSRSEVDLTREFKFCHSTLTWEGVPVVAANMDTTGTFEMAKKFAENRMIVCIHKHYSLEEWLKFAENNASILNYCAVSLGTSDSDISKLQDIMKAIPGIPFICLDVANGYSEYFVKTVQKIRQLFENKIIIAGNVVTGEMTEQLILSGADIIKVGIGSGAVCTTRKQTGVGCPQLSAIIDCSDAAHGLNGHVMSDGGCCCPGDFAKAFGAGADFIMAGGMFSGHDESSGDLIEKNGKKYKLFYGMSSATAMKKYFGKVANYRSSEGKAVEVPYKGGVQDTISDLLGGLRSACTYVGAKKLKELAKRTVFIRVTRQLNTIYNTLEDVSKKK